MPASIYIPNDRLGWWGGLDTRPRCADCHKVVMKDQSAAERSAQSIRMRGTENMFAYLGKCGHWHVGHRKTRRR